MKTRDDYEMLSLTEKYAHEIRDDVYMIRSKYAGPTFVRTNHELKRLARLRSRCSSPQ